MGGQNNFEIMFVNIERVGNRTTLVKLLSENTTAACHSPKWLHNRTFHVGKRNVRNNVKVHVREVLVNIKKILVVSHSA